MKNLFKKISAILIAAIMVLAMASTAFAADAAATTATGSITVTGLTANDGTTLKVYKVVGLMKIEVTGLLRVGHRLMRLILII